MIDLVRISSVTCAELP